MTHKKRSPIGKIKKSLRAEMLRAGGKLSGLNPQQRWPRRRNNDSSGETYQPQEGEQITMSPSAAHKTSEVHVTETVSEDIPPAGGNTDQQVGRALRDLLFKAGAAVGESTKKTYGQKLLDASVPAAKTIVVTLAVYGGITFIERRWGRNSDERKRLTTTAAVSPMMKAG